MREMDTKKEYNRKRYQKYKEIFKANAKKNRMKHRMDHYAVYYLPEENYVGLTNRMEQRIKEHNRQGKNVENWRVLYCSEDKKEAAYHEALYHSVLGMEGLDYRE